VALCDKAPGEREIVGILTLLMLLKLIRYVSVKNAEPAGLDIERHQRQEEIAQSS